MSDEIKITFIGDIMCQREQNIATHSRSGAPGYDETFSAVTGRFRDSDYVVGNLETPIAGEALGYTSDSSRFNTPETFLDALKNAGIDFLTTANNHSLDRGIPGLDRTIEHLRSRQFGFTGTYSTQEESDRIFVKDIKGLKIAFLSFTYGTNSEYYGDPLPPDEEWRIDLLKKQQVRPIPNPSTRGFITRVGAILPQRIWMALSALKGKTRPSIPDFVADNVSPHAIDAPEHATYIARAKEKIQRAKELADIVVLLPHIGGQYNPAPGAYHKWTMHWMAETGVDVIVANHAHTSLRCENFANGCIGAYALGNFCFTPGVGWFLPNTLSEYSIALDLYLSKKEKRLTRTSFSVLKTIVAADGFASVHPVAELLAQEKDPVSRERLVIENEAVVNRFRGTSGTVVPNEQYSFHP
jgi:poly-gamma-glutamate synthesis protein (capsule biosynthesis protein)